ncbi:MAG: HAMP domain-containing histidine kinase [Clostridia bacterium]|nr:HAMP domain-containing histidine kinase [Clostridia bacterium]
MINNLKRKIILIVTLSLSVIMIGVTVFFAVNSYRETVNQAGIMVDRFIGDKGPDNNDNRMPIEENAENATPRTFDLEEDIEGVYRFSVSNGEAAAVSGNAESDIKELAQQAAEKSADNGIIKNYIFRKRVMGDKTDITLIESADSIKNLNINIIVIFTVCVFSVLLIFFISKKITNTIVKPVEETFSKQKQFISDASHELKTPLAVIEANAGVLETEIGENKWINYIHNEIESMNKLVNDLLLLAKSEDIKQGSKDIFDLSKTVELTAAGFEGLAFEKGVKIQFEIEKDLKMQGDGEDIKHIVSTLTDNAIKHTEKDGSVSVMLKKHKNEYIIEVKNEGEEIKEEDRERIFERFYRVDKARNRAEKRYGLGLSIAKQCAQKYNGDIKVYCKDGVTTFRVTLISK